MSDRYVKDFEQPIMSILTYLGGKATSEQIYEEFALRFPSVIKNSYWNEEVDGDSRWHNYINRCKDQILLPRCVLKSGKEDNTWEVIGIP